MTLNHYQQQRWQLHAQLQSVRSALENLEQQLNEIDAGLLNLNPEQKMTPQISGRDAATASHRTDNQDIPLPIAAG